MIPQKTLEDKLKIKMEDGLKKMEDNLQNKWKAKTTSTKTEDDLKKTN
jgi:hypothetical protein